MKNRVYSLTVVSIQLELVVNRYLYAKVGERHFIIEWNRRNRLF